MGTKSKNMDVDDAAAHAETVEGNGQLDGVGGQPVNRTEQSLTSARAQIARLQAELERERGTTADLAERNEQLLAEQSELRTRVVELETYVDGRKQQWAELHAKIAEYQDAIAGLGKTLKSKDSVTAAHLEEKHKLAQRILELEREAAEMAGRRKEREAAYEELQRKLAAQTEITERLRAEHAIRGAEADKALARAADQDERIAALERAVSRRDENVAALERELEAERTAQAEVRQSREQLEQRVVELERELNDERSRREPLREQVCAVDERLRVAEGELATAAAEQRAGRERAGNDARRIAVLEHAGAASASLRGRVEAAEGRIGAPEAEGDAAADEASRLKTDLTAQQDLVPILKTELRAKRARVELLEERLQRVSKLSESLAALDLELPELQAATETNAAADTNDTSGTNDAIDAPDASGADDADIPFLDFAETLAVDDEVDGSRPSLQELLPVEAFMSDTDLEQNGVDIGQAQGASPRKLVALLNGDGVDYVLTKEEMTIGRGKRSDIRIRSHFISRIHARIKTHGSETVIEDAGSRNGILVNSERVERCVLRDGDIVSLGGELDLRFVDAQH